MPLLSPDTGLPLQPLDFASVQLNVCPQTGGIWFDRGEIARLRELNDIAPLDAQVKSGETQPTIAPGSRKCPNDGSSLAQFYYAEDHNIRLDSCPVCGGVWADHESLDNLATHVARETREVEPLTAHTMPANLSPEAKMALAQMQMSHDQYRARAGALTSFFRFMGSWWYYPAWWY